MIYTQAIRRHIADLDKARERRNTGQFMAQGTKAVMDTLGHFALRCLVATDAWLAEHPLPGVDPSLVAKAPMREMGRMSTLKTPPEVITVYDIPRRRLDIESLKKDLVVALDCVQDPGNLGTILRLCDWMGVRHVLCSPDTADAFSPKAVQATMGSISRVAVYYAELPSVLPSLAPVYGTLLEGENIYTAPLAQTGVLVMGSEGRGLSAEVRHCLTTALTIPPYPVGADTGESLNVAVAAAVALSQIRARTYSHG